MTASLPRSVQHWAVGVTTAPRKEPTLERTLASLAKAGWDRPLLFAEPGVEPPPAFADLPVTRRGVTLGAFANWSLALCELYFREPLAEAYFLCQDDVLFSAGLREYLERVLWPAAEVGVVSVYCPSHYSGGGCERSHGEGVVPRRAPPEGWSQVSGALRRGRGTDAGGFRSEDRGWGSWGALAYVFPNPSVRALISDPLLAEHRHHGPAEGMRNVDSVVGHWCQRSGRPYYVHVPSLAQHIGETSTIWPSAAARGRRRARTFPERIA